MLSGCDVKKGMSIKSSDEFPKQISSSIEKQTQNRLLLTGKKAVLMKKSMLTYLSKKAETVNESLPEQNASTPAEQPAYDRQKGGTSQPTTSQTENIPDKPSKNCERAKADEPKKRRGKNIYNYEFDVATIQQKLIVIDTEMSL